MEALAAAGFDLLWPFDPRGFALGPEPRGILVGNTRALWAPFSAALPHLPAEDPLDHYAEAHIGAAFPGARIYYSHRLYDGAYVPLQRLAVATGLGALSPGQLVIHPVVGPWLALRAVVLLPPAGAARDDGAPARAPIAKPCVCESPCRAALDRALAEQTPEAWLAVRDACTLRMHRYSDEQVRYHYTRAWPSR